MKESYVMANVNVYLKMKLYKHMPSQKIDFLLQSGYNHYIGTLQTYAFKEDRFSFVVKVQLMLPLGVPLPEELTFY